MLSDPISVYLILRSEGVAVRYRKGDGEGNELMTMYSCHLIIMLSPVLSVLLDLAN